MTLGLFLILIVTLPFTIYLYIVNKKLKIQIEDLEKKQKTLLERKIYASLEKDVLPLSEINNKEEINIKNKPVVESQKEEIIPKSQNNSPPPTIDKKNTFDVEEYIIKKNNNSITDKKEYLEKLSYELSQKIKPQTIELTEYEKNEEENAIISYQELKEENKKEKLYYFKEEDNTKDFIESLKQFRDDLNS